MLHQVTMFVVAVFARPDKHLHIRGVLTKHEVDEWPRYGYTITPPVVPRNWHEPSILEQPCYPIPSDVTNAP